VRKSVGEYPANWPEIAMKVKDEAGWKCVRCGHPHDIDSGRVLTVHHIDMDPSSCEWWNIVALCHACHLHVQGRVVIERPWIFEHSEWFKLFAAGYYAHRDGLPHDRESVIANLNELLKRSG
jgi:5-methylcytosine-specific restriction endonuclease McrA